MRAFRVDKFTLASLGATLKEYYNTEESFKNIPVLNMISKKYEKLYDEASKFIENIKIINNKISAYLIDTNDQIGGGTAPNVFLKGVGVSVKVNGINTEKLESMLRNNEIPIIARIQDDCIVFVFRTLNGDNTKCILDFFKTLKYE